MIKFERIKRIIAATMLVSVAFSYIPALSSMATVVAQAAEIPPTAGAGSLEESSGGDQTQGGSLGSKLEDGYGVVPSTDVPAFTEFKGMTSEASLVEYTLPKDSNTYSLTVATGASSGECIMYFAIKYKDKDGTPRSEFVFPKIDALQRSRDLLNYYADNKDLNSTFGSTILTKYGYTQKVEEVVPLSAWSSM